MNVISRLKTIPLFKSIKDKDDILQKLGEIVTEQSFPMGTYIIKEGEIGKTMFILAKGTVSIEKTTLMGDNFTVAKLSDNHNVFFGEIALLDSVDRSASVYAVTDTICYVIDKDDFNRFSEANPFIGFLIIKDIASSLASKLRKTTNDNLVLINALCCDEMDI